MKKSSPKVNKSREKRILMEIVVDAYDSDERFMGWQCYLQDSLKCPFTAACIAEHKASPLKVKDKVEVINVPDVEDYGRTMLVTIRWNRKSGLAVPLSQLQPVAATDELTKQAVADWHYWLKMGYSF